MRNTLNRKYLTQAIDASLERFGLDFVDVVYCHRSDPNTPIEETVWAMSDMVIPGQGALLGHQRVVGRRDPSTRSRSPTATTSTSRSPSSRSTTSSNAARSRSSTPDCTTTSGYGNTIWSPLASGLLTGKYRDGIPEGSRAALDGYEWLADRMTDAEAIAKIENLRPIADRLGCSMAQLALAWCTKHPMVSTVITGASRVEQVVQNFEALDVIPLLTDEVKAEMEAAVS